MWLTELGKEGAERDQVERERLVQFGVAPVVTIANHNSSKYGQLYWTLLILVPLHSVQFSWFDWTTWPR